MAKKIVLTVVLVSVLAGACLWAGATWLIGSGIESSMTRSHDPAPDSEFFEISHEIDRGFFSSDAKSRLALRGGAMGSDGLPEQSLVLNHQMFHGPLAFTPDGPVPCSNYVITAIDLDDFDEEIRDTISTVFKGQPPLMIRTTTDLGRSGTVQISMAPAQWEDPAKGGGRMEFEGAEITVSAAVGAEDRLEKAFGEVSLGGWRAQWAEGTIEAQPGSGSFDYLSDQSLTGNLTLGEVSSTFANGTLRVGSLALEFDQQRLSEGLPLFLGNSGIELTELTFTSEIGDMGLKNALIQANSGVDNGKLFGSVKYGVGEMSIPPLLAGPMAPFLPAMQKGMSVQVGAKGFELQTVESLIDKAQKMQAIQVETMTTASLASGTALENSPAYREALTEYFSEFLDLFVPGISLTQRLEINGMTGSSHADLEFHMTGAEALRQKTTLRSLIESLGGELSISVSKSDLPMDQIAPMAEGLTASGFLVDESVAITGKALLSNGLLHVNGQPTPLIDSLGPNLDQPINWEEIISTIGTP